MMNADQARIAGKINAMVGFEPAAYLIDSVLKSVFMSYI